MNQPPSRPSRPSSPKDLPLITPPIIPSAPYYMTPPQILYLTTPCCNMSTVNNMNIVPHNMTDTPSDNLPLAFPSLNYQEAPRSNTPESDQHSIISNNTVNTTNTNNTTTNTTINNTVLTSFSINDINDMNHLDIDPKPNTSDDEYHIPTEDLEEEDEDIDIYITTKHMDKKKKKKRKKKKKKSRKRVKKRTLSSVHCEFGVLPEARGHLSIPWSDLCETKLQCHLCDTVYDDRTQYIDCLKAHYHDKDNDLVYLECELCLTHPTKQSLDRKERLLRNGVGQSEPNKWRQSKHVANFISHIAGHKGMNPGFYCKVKVWDNRKECYVRCGAPGSTLQNLAKHVYNMHYKLDDIDDQYCVDPTHGYCDKSKLKKLHKISRNTKKKSTKPKTCGSKRKRRIKKTKKKQESESEYAFSDEDSEHENVAYRKKKKRKLNNNRCTVKTDDAKNDLLIPEAMGHQCWSLQQQNVFLSYLWFAAAPELTCLADYVCDEDMN